GGSPDTSAVFSIASAVVSEPDWPEACATAAGLVAVAVPVPSPIAPSSAFTPTVSPSLATISCSTPAAGAGTSTVTLSVSSSTIGSSIAMVSPTFLYQRPIVASDTDSPSVGTRISVAIFSSRQFDLVYQPNASSS